AAGLVVDDAEGPTPEDIRRALGHLAFNQRAALVMREIEGRSYADIAQLLGLSLAAVETLIFRARRALREQLEGSLTCDEAELAISRQLDDRLSRTEKGQLRAHLRECAACATLARRQRAQRTALRSLGAVSLPPSLAGLFGGGGAGVAVKVAAVVLAAGAAGGAGYDLHRSLAAPSHAGSAPSRAVHAAKAPPAPRASHGRPAWAHAPAVSSSHASSAGQAHAATPPASPGRGHVTSLPPQSHAPTRTTTTGQGSGASISSKRRPHP